jgi:hypothetical protein
MEFSATRTPVTAHQLFDALAVAWPGAVGGTPSKASLLTLLAQSAFETGNWSAMRNNNIGNFKATSGQDFFTITCNEVVNGQVVSGPCSFRAYPDLASGAADYLRHLAGRFQGAWRAVLAGDPAAFSHALKQEGYYTGDEGTYTAGVEAKFASLSRALGGVSVPTSWGFWTVVGSLLAGGAAAYAYLTRPLHYKRSAGKRRG